MPDIPTPLIKIVGAVKESVSEALTEALANIYDRGFEEGRQFEREARREKTGQGGPAPAGLDSKLPPAVLDEFIANFVDMQAHPVPPGSIERALAAAAALLENDLRKQIFEDILSNPSHECSGAVQESARIALNGLGEGRAASED